MMVGRELGDYYGKREISRGAPVAVVRDLATADGALQPASLQIHAGEIVGVAGLVGSGKAELGMALGGAIDAFGSVHVDGHEVDLGDPRTTLAGGIGYVPDDRKRAAILPTRSVAENFSLAWNGQLSRRGLLKTRDERQKVDDAIERYGVVTASPASLITTLSGGNQQKVVLGRVFALGVRLLVLNEPTRGIDVGAKSEIYRLMQEEAEAGAGVILISSELPELLGIADRIVVFYGGRICGEFAGDDMTEQAVAHAAVTGDVDAAHAPNALLEVS
jgi:ABC-type sugar transport system ATPase subunit